MRTLLQKTFEERHVPYTTGEKQLPGLSDPACWSEDESKDKKKKKPRRRYKPPETEKVSDEGAGNTEGGECEYVYDSEEEEWVKIE